MAKKFKTLDGEKYYRQAFAIPGKASDPETWKLPHHGPGDTPHNELAVDWDRLPGAATAAATGEFRGQKLDATDDERKRAARHLLAHYRKDKKDPPDSLLDFLGMKKSEAAKTKIGPGKPLSEMVKGSYDYMMSQIRQAFYRQFSPNPSWDEPFGFLVFEIFADYVIVEDPALEMDEFWRVNYTLTDQGYVFDPEDQWQLVELTYQPAQMVESMRLSQAAEGPDGVQQDAVRFVECVNNAVRLEEATAGKPRVIKGTGITADVVNANGRRYPSDVLRAGVREAKRHLHESLGQGRLGVLTGEAEHPSDKGQRPRFLETIVRWTDVQFNEETKQVEIEGAMLETSQGRDAIAIMEGGVLPGISQRGYGKSKMVKEGDLVVEEVIDLIITGYDLLAPGEQSDPNGQINIFESQSKRRLTPMDPKELIKMLMENGVLEMLEKGLMERIQAAQAEQNETRSLEMLREALGVKSNADLGKAVESLIQEVQKRKQPSQIEADLRAKVGAGETEDPLAALDTKLVELNRLQEAERKRQVLAYVDEQAKDINYPDWLKKQFVDAVKGANPGTVEEAKKVFIEKRKEYDAIMSELALRAQGYGRVAVLGPTLERETGMPDFARVSFALNESMQRAGLGQIRKWNRGLDEMSPGERFAKLLLEKFDKAFQSHLVAESRSYEEAEQASDLNLPYSVARAVIAEAVPNLVAASIFDVGVADQSEFRLYYEAYSGESGASVAVTDEAVTITALGTWYDLTYGRVQPGTVTVTSNPAGTTYTEGTDYAIDYANGKILGISGGGISALDSVLVDFTYDAIRKGEGVGIERGKQSLSYVLVSAAADRLATDITDEVIKFARSQIGYDAITRTLAALVREIREKIDQGMMFLALGKALSVASNSGGTWSATPGGGDTYQQNLDKLFRYIGVAKVKIVNRYYEPTFILASSTNADVMGNSEQFTAAGLRPDADLNAAGFVGRARGLPLFHSPLFSDSWIMVGNREIVMYRVFSAMTLEGPFPTFDANRKLVASKQYYAEEYNVTEAPVANKAAVVKITA